MKLNRNRTVETVKPRFPGSLPIVSFEGAAIGLDVSWFLTIVADSLVVSRTSDSIGFSMDNILGLSNNSSADEPM